MITPGSVIYDVGAHVGFYTLFFSELAGPTGRVVAFEPNPRNVHYLRKHMEINAITNVDVIEVAASDSVGVATFAENSESSTGHLSGQGNLQVSTITLDWFVACSGIPRPDYVKIDVEGAEASVLHGAHELLTSTHPTVFLATHSKELHAQCCEFLQSLGYHLQPVLPGTSVTQTDEIVAMHRQAA